MKPSNATSESPVFRPAKAATAVPVSDELRSIDTSLLDQLLGIRKERARLEDFRTRAAELKDSVQERVWRRVAADYAKRADALEQQATPLKARVRGEYRKLRSLFDRIEASHDDARLEKEEVEFRHSVGEVAQAELEERLQGPNGILERCRADLATLEQEKARFLEAFDSEQDLEADAPSGDLASRRVDKPDSPDHTTLVDQDAAGSVVTLPLQDRPAAGRASPTAPGHSGSPV